MGTFVDADTYQRKKPQSRLQSLYTGVVRIDGKIYKWSEMKPKRIFLRSFAKLVDDYPLLAYPTAEQG